MLLKKLLQAEKIIRIAFWVFMPIAIICKFVENHYRNAGLFQDSQFFYDAFLFLYAFAVLIAIMLNIFLPLLKKYVLQNDIKLKKMKNDSEMERLGEENKHVK